MNYAVGTVLVNPNAVKVVDYNKYRGLGRPRTNDYTTTVKHLLEGRKEPRIKKSQPMRKVAIEKRFDREDKITFLLFISLILLPLLGRFLNQ